MALTRYSIEIYGYFCVVWAIATTHYQTIEAKLLGSSHKIKRKIKKPVAAEGSARQFCTLARIIYE